MPSDRPPLTQARLKELLHYDPETGVFTWRVARGSAPAGRRAGGPVSYGYRGIRVDSVLHREHRLAWLYVRGEVPTCDIDHANRDRSDNRWNNLRLASRSDNLLNQGASSRNTSGHRNVAWDHRAGRWRVEAQVRGRRTYLGAFSVLSEAVARAERWRAENHGAFFNTASTRRAHADDVVSLA